MSEQVKNTDKEIWRGKSRAEFGDDDRFYADSLSIPASNVEALTIHCGGFAITKPIREWHRLASEEISVCPTCQLETAVNCALATTAPDKREPPSLAERELVARLQEATWWNAHTVATDVHDSDLDGRVAGIKKELAALRRSGAGREKE